MSTLPHYLATARDTNNNTYRLFQMGNYWYSIHNFETDDMVNLDNTSFEDAFAFLNGLGNITSTRWDS